MIDGAMEAAPGIQGMLTIDGVPVVLPFRVRDAHAGATHIKFDLDEPQAAAFRHHFLKLTRGVPGGRSNRRHERKRPHGKPDTTVRPFEPLTWTGPTD